jgi:hypothetical protein
MTEREQPTLRLRAAAAPWREVDGEAIVLDLESSLYLSVNHSGTLLWSALADGTTRAEMVDLLVDTYGIEPAHAQEDVDAFVESCRARNLLEP